ncbi:MAG: 6-bladed beta-propeller [Acidobacteriota bacterium]|nr:MAG: 6-bladed beta-propeller [Acidobacteriota bacterium]
MAVVFAAAMLAACAHGPAPSTGARPRIVWPPAPDPARIEFVQSISTPKDVGIRASWFKRAVLWIARGRVVRGMARPFAIAVGADGRIVVADPDARSVHLFDPTRSRYERLVKAGDGPLVSPIGVAIDTAGQIYVSDSASGEVHRFDERGRWLGPFGTAAEIGRPTGLAYDTRAERLYVVDTIGHRIVGLDSDGEKVLDAGRRGTGPGEFNYPVAIAIDRDGLLYVADAMNFRIQVLDGAGQFVREFGRPGRATGQFDKIKGLALDSDGHVYVSDALHDVVQVFDREGRLLTVIGGSGSRAGEFWLPAGLYIDASDRIFVADSANHRIQVLRYLGSLVAENTG